MSRILIIQLGDIGDVVWATPTFRAVKEAYPQANVSVLIREGFGSLLEADPCTHKIFEVKRYKGNLLKKAFKQLSFIRDYAGSILIWSLTFAPMTEGLTWPFSNTPKSSDLATDIWASSAPWVHILS